MLDLKVSDRLGLHWVDAPGLAWCWAQRRRLKGGGWQE